MDPVTIGVLGVAGAGMLGQWMNSQAAAKATAAERDSIRNMLNQIQQPGFDTSRLNPKDLQVAGKYLPQIAQFATEKDPTLIQAASQGAVAGRGAQMQALGQFQNLGQTGEDAQSRLMIQQALQQAQQQNQGQQESIRQGMAQRGMGGSGMSLVDSLLAQQGNNKNATQAAQNQGLAAYQNRLAALRESAGLGAQIRGEDVSQETQNAGVMNDFNRRMAQNQNAYNQYAAGQNNQAQMYNQNNAQNIMNQNIQQGNQYSQAYQDMLNNLAQRGYTNQMNKASIMAGQGQAQIGDINNAAAARSNAISGAQQGVNTGINAYQNQQNQNNQNDYNNQMLAIQRHKAGMDQAGYNSAGEDTSNAQPGSAWG